jgi:transposase
MSSNGPVCDSGLKRFINRTEAVAHAASIGQPEEPPYLCDQCRGWHLVKKSTARPVVFKTKIRHTRSDVEDRRRRVKQLMDSGMSSKQIAEQTGVALGVVYNDQNRIKHGVLGVTPHIPPSAPVPITLDALTQKRMALEVQLAAARKQEDIVREAQTLKIVPTNEGKGFLIMKDGQKFAMQIKDGYELADRLTEFLCGLKGDVQSKVV